MPKLIWSDASLRDLRAISTYLVDHDPAAAGRILQAIRSKADQLRAYPLSGPMLTNELRYLSVRSTPYVIVYVTAEQRIEVLRVRHGREDWRPA